MEFLSEVQYLEKYGPPSALYENEINNLIKLTRPTKNDVFYDLGSGHGDVVRHFYAKSKVSRAVGLEAIHKRFLILIEKTRDEFTRNIKNIDFWCTPFQDYNFSDATIIYCGIDEISNDSKADGLQEALFCEYFGKKKIKIIKRDLPLVGYKAVKPIKDRHGSWFFLMNSPLNEYIIENKQKWIQSVLGKKGKTTRDLAKYITQQHQKRGFLSSNHEIVEFCKNFERIAKKRFVC